MAAERGGCDASPGGIASIQGGTTTGPVDFHMGELQISR